MASQKTSTIYSKIPAKYSKAFIENIKVLNLIFSPYKDEDIPNIISFLHLYTEVFNLYSEKYTLPKETFENFVGDTNLLNKCIQKHREIFRQSFRGVQYLPTKKFGEVADKAYSDVTSYLLSENPSSILNIKLRIKLERKWIEAVNDQRRTNNLEAYKVECIEKFKTTIKEKFPFLYEPEVYTSLEYIDENRGDQIITELLACSETQFRSQLPFADQESDLEVGHLLFEFLQNLKENVIKDLIVRNSRNRKAADDYVDKIVAKAAKKYGNEMGTFLLEDYKSYVLDAEIILNEHKRIIENKILSLVATKNLKTFKELETRFTMKYHVKARQVLLSILQTWLENEKLKLRSKYEEGRLGMSDGFTKFKGIFAEIGMPEIADDFSSYVEETMKSAFERVQGTNIATISKLETLTKPSLVQNDEHAAIFARDFQSWEIFFMRKIVLTLQDSTKKPAAILDTMEITSAIQTAAAHIWPTTQQLDPEIREEVKCFMKKLGEELLNNRDLLRETIKRFNDSTVKFEPSPFREGAELDTMNNNQGRRIYSISRGNLQSIIQKNGQSDMSFEELRLDEWNRQNQLCRAALNMVFGAGQNGEISAAFERSLNLNSTVNLVDTTAKYLV